MHGITDNKTLDQLVYGLEPIIGCEVLKENPQTFEEACVLAKHILQIENLVKVADVGNVLNLQIMPQ